MWLLGTWCKLFVDSGTRAGNFGGGVWIWVTVFRELDVWQVIERMSSDSDMRTGCVLLLSFIGAIAAECYASFHIRHQVRGSTGLKPNL